MSQKPHFAPLAMTKKIFSRFVQRPLRWFEDLPIRTKLLIFAGILIAPLIALAGFTRFQLNVIENRQIPARAAAREMQSALLTMHIAEQQFISETSTSNVEFYVRQKSSSIDSWHASYTQFETNYDDLLKLLDDEALKGRIRPLKAQVVQYRDTFVLLTQAYRERGFKSFGREGLLRQRAATIENNVKGRPQAHIALLQMTRAQDTFLMYQETSAITTFNDHATHLRSLLTSTSDRTALDEYTRAFQEVIAIDRKIGLTSSEGLRGTLATHVAALTPVVLAIENDVLASTNAHIKFTSRSITVVTLLTAIATVLMAIAIALLITRRVELLLKASRRITSGDFDYRVPVQNNDELGRLATSFNMMTQKLQAGRKALRERADDLAQSVNRFELVTRAVHEAVYEWDIKTDTLRWGEGLVTVFGYHQKERDTVVDWWTSRIHPDDAQAVNNSLDARMKRHSSAWKMEYRFKKANGQYAYCQDHGFIEYKNGQPARMVGSLIDVTRQKELERAKDEFISIASHQLRTPLGSIRWNLELLTAKLNALPRDVGEYVQEAYKSTLRMLGLVSDLLSVARIEQGRVQDLPEKTNLNEIIMLAIDEMRLFAAQRQITVDKKALKNAIEVTIDPKRFREVIQNLLSNAIKYTPPGGKVTVGLISKTDNVIISIADTGIGIPAEEHANMFTKFFRAKNVTATDTEGSGLGLFVVKSYVESWGGRIWFESQVNKGTTFYIDIPRKPRIQKDKHKLQ